MNLSDIKNEDLKNFMTAIGALTELWAFTYTNFMKQFNDDKELAMDNTAAFMHILITGMLLERGES